MKYLIVPDFKNISETMDVARKYDAGFEYDDFFSPVVYDDNEEIEKRIGTYLELNRDLGQDTLHGAFLGLDIAAADEIIRERSRVLYEQSLKIAYRMGVKGVVFHTGLVGGLRLEYYLDNWLEKSVYFWTEMCGKYPELTIFMENSFEQEPDIFVRLMDRMQNIKNFRICLDYGHAILTKTPVDIWVEKLATYIGHVHLNDNDLQDDLHLVPGKGKIDFIKWKKLMKKYDIDTTVLLELNGVDKARDALEYITELMENDDEL